MNLAQSVSSTTTTTTILHTTVNVMPAAPASSPSLTNLIIGIMAAVGVGSIIAARIARGTESLKWTRDKLLDRGSAYLIGVDEIVNILNEIADVVATRGAGLNRAACEQYIQPNTRFREQLNTLHAKWLEFGLVANRGTRQSLKAVHHFVQHELWAASEHGDRTLYAKRREQYEEKRLDVELRLRAELRVLPRRVIRKRDNQRASEAFVKDVEQVLRGPQPGS